MVAEGPWSVTRSGGGKDIDPAGESDLSRQVEVGLEAPLVARLEDVLRDLGAASRKKHPGKTRILS